MPVDIAFNGTANIVARVRNSGNTAHTFYVGLSLRDPTGAVHDFPVISMPLEVGVENTASIPIAELNIEGLWDAIVSVWRVSPVPGTPETDRLANTGWILGAINVLPAIAPPVPPVISAEIIEVLINNERVF